jgi:outer membrane lipoprotein SlyB
MTPDLARWLRVLALAAVALFVAANLSGCEADEFTVWATVVGVEELDHEQEPPPELTLRDEDIRIPEVGWKIDLRTDDGQTVSVQRQGNRHYEPGERVQLIRTDDGDLLL